MIFFISDTHFGHGNIIRHCNRPFASVDEHDEVLITNINQSVGADDVLYHLGDFAFKNHNYYLDRLECNHIHLLHGNHDKKITLHPKLLQYGSFGIDLKIKGYNFTLCHYPIRTWNLKHYGAIHLFGHVHHAPVQCGLSWNVGVDLNDYCPVAFESIIAKAQACYDEIDHEFLGLIGKVDVFEKKSLDN